MGVYYTTYVGPYINFDTEKTGKTIDVSEDIKGCETCKTKNNNNFCEKCGSPTKIWVKRGKKQFNCGYDFLRHVANEKSDEEYDNLVDTFHGLEYNYAIIPNKSGYGKHLDNNDSESFAIDIEDAREKLESFKTDSGSFLMDLKSAGFEFEVVYGVIAYAS